MKIISLDSAPVAGVSHDTDVKKQVLLKFGDVPNVTQFAYAVLKPGQQATKHFHKVSKNCGLIVRLVYTLNDHRPRRLKITLVLILF
jgi:hypothetical protein